MTSPTQVLKSVGPKLVPFFKTVAIYFVLFIPVERPSWFSMVIKCLPIFSLIIFVLLHGMSLGDEYAFSRRIIVGLLFSALGDAFLIWDEYFLHGMAAFGVAQIMYSSAFGFKPLKPKLGAFLYCISAIANYIILPGLYGPLVIGVPVYNILLMTAVWRAMARVQFFEDLWTWTKLCSCAGTLLFAVSDGCIALHRFVTPIAYSQALIMVTYYAAQLGIALSVVDSRHTFMAAKNKEAAAALKESSSTESKPFKSKKAMATAH